MPQRIGAFRRLFYSRIQTFFSASLNHCLALAALLILSNWALVSYDWQSGPNFHTSLEVLSTTMALVVGLMAIVRYYSQKNALLLLLGTAFMGTAFLDGFHAIVTSTYFKQFMPSDLPSLIPWSWVASRWYLSVFLLASSVVWRLDVDRRLTAFRGEMLVYGVGACFTLTCFLFFVFYPLPQAYYAEFFLHRPEELLPALFFFLALVSIIRSKNWTADPIEYWLVISLTVDLCAQVVYMPFSARLFDLEFDVAHMLKLASYSVMFFGLLRSMHFSFKQVKTGEARLRSIMDTTAEGIIVVEANGIVSAVNKSAENIFGYAADEIVGNNISMLMPAPYRDEHDQYLDTHLRTGKMQIMGVGRDVEGRRKDGTIFPLHLSVGKFEMDGNPVFVGSIEDISKQRQAEEEIRRQNERLAHQSMLLKTVLENVDEGISYYDSDLKLAMFNKKYVRMFGIPEGHFEIGDNLADIFRYKAERGEYGPGDIQEQVAERVERARKFQAHCYERARPDGTVIMVTGNPIGKSGMVSSYRDVTARVRSEEKLQNSRNALQKRVDELAELKLQLEKKTSAAYQMAEDLRQAKNVQHDAIQNISEGFVLWGSDDNLIMCNDVFRSLYTGLEDVIVPDTPFKTFITEAYGRGVLSKPKRKQLALAVNERLQKHRGSIVAFDEQLGNGSWVRVSERVTSDDRVVGIITDISERKKWEKQLKQMAETDALTGLPNRMLFQDRLQNALDQATRLESLVGVMVLDLDRFKDINDTLGHPAGDDLLLQVADRILDCARKTDTVARLGGDEFAVIATNLKSPLDVEHLANRIVQALAKPFKLGDQVIHSGSSIGITIFPQDLGNPDDLLRNADIALYRAKADGGNIFRLYDEEIDCEVQNRQKQEIKLREAIERDEFVLVYQPQIDLQSGRLIGAEALLRWNDPERGIVAPGDFIDVAEATRLIIPISNWVLKHACDFNKSLQTRGLAQITISVNISPLQFKEQGFMQGVSEALQMSALDPSYLELEITETAAMAHRGDVLKLLNDLKSLGIKLAIDDFGTGFSSLSRLKDFPVDRLKIDQSFVRDLGDSTDHRAISAAIVTLGHNLGLKVIAEGAETALHMTVLKELKCDEVQGYYISKPLFEDDFIDFLQSAGEELASA